MKLVVNDNSTHVIEVLSDEDAKPVIPYEQKIKKQPKMKIHNPVEIVPQFYQEMPLPPLPPLYPEMSESFLTKKANP